MVPRSLGGDNLLLQQPTGETQIPVEDHDQPTYWHGSSVAELLQLTSANSIIDIGDTGPVMASLPLREHAHDPEYRKYEALFGRDSLRVADTLLLRFPRLARVTLLRLAELQGCSFDTAREEEPGRIVHESRDPLIDPIARQLSEERGWGWPYYGSVDATPQFVRVLAHYVRKADEGADIFGVRYKGRDGELHDMGYALSASLDWITSRLDANPEGLLEFKAVAPNGIENQTWRDSWDSFFHADGTMANHSQGIASTEVQRGAMDALFDAAELYEKYLYEPQRAVELRARAENLRDAIMKHMWTDDKGGYFVLGTDRDDDGQLRQLRVRTSDMGHLLHSRLLDGNDPEIKRRREAVVQQLFSEEMLCLNGIRTLASDEVHYREGAYHNGSVWPWQNYLISQGLERHGYYGLARYLNDLLLDDFNATGRSPEFLRGSSDPDYRLNTEKVVIFDRINKRENVVEQPPQDIQAWSVAAKYAIKHHAYDLNKLLRNNVQSVIERRILIRLKAVNVLQDAVSLVA